MKNGIGFVLFVGLKVNFYTYEGSSLGEIPWGSKF